MNDPLAPLLEQIDPVTAAEFVRGQIGSLLDYDREHGTGLADALERALDGFPHGAASGLRDHALELLEADLEVPETRLAVQLALRLRPAVGQV